MFQGTFERQLDSKRRITVPSEYRAAAAGPFSGIICFPSIEADCIEAGGKPLYDSYDAIIQGLPFGDSLRLALETMIYGGLEQLAFDTAGRITLPEMLCDMFGLTDWVTVVGLGDRFQIWERDAFRAHRSALRQTARDGWAELRRRPRTVATSEAAP